MNEGIQISNTGGVDVMQLVDLPLKSGGPGTNEVRIKHTIIGVNYIDTYHRSGLYPVPLPATLGLEAVGVVSAVGLGVNNFKVGDRVGYVSGPTGAYVQERDYSSKMLIKIPDYIEDESAAAILLKGMTVEYLFNRTYKINNNMFFLFHAAAGGVGLVACQWARAIGAKMIGTVSTEKKARLAKDLGCEYVINYKSQDVADEVMKITNGRGVDVVYDGVGKDTFQTTIDCLADRGLFVSFGQSSGMVGLVGLHETFAPKNLFVSVKLIL